MFQVLFLFDGGDDDDASDGRFWSGWVGFSRAAALNSCSFSALRLFFPLSLSLALSLSLSLQFG